MKLLTVSPNQLMVDVTGKEDEVPRCPRHSEDIGLVPIMRYRGSKPVTGYWSCPQCHHVFRPPSQSER